MDKERKFPADGTLVSVNSNRSVTSNRFKSNIMIIKAPEHLRSPNEPVFHLATVDRSIPGNDFSGNKILDKIYPGLPKVTLFEEPKPREDTPSPKRCVQKQEFAKPRQAKYSNAGHRPNYNRKPSPERNHRSNVDEISPWIPGNEPYMPYRSGRIPFIAESGPQKSVEYPDIGNRCVHDSFLPHRENHPQEYLHNPGGFSDAAPPNYPGSFANAPPHNLSRGFSDLSPQPNYPNSTDFLPNPLPKHNNLVRHSFPNRNHNSRVNHSLNNCYQEAPSNNGMLDFRNFNLRDDVNVNQPFKSKINYSNRRRSHSRRRRAFQTGQIRTATNNWNSIEEPGPSTCNKARGKKFATATKPREGFHNQGKPFTRRDRQNYR